MGVECKKMSAREPMAIEIVENFLSKNDIPMARIKAWNDDHYDQLGNRRKAFITTYGCQMNEHDSEKLDGMFQDMGFDGAETIEEADIILFNTCCVRENAELKVYGNLGRVKNLKQSNPNLLVGLCGCMMQQPHIVEELKKKYRFVDLIFGTHNLHHFPVLLDRVIRGEQVIEVLKDGTEIVEGYHPIRKNELKAYVNIMYGCNNFCSYCIVPYTRGRERSRRPDDIIKEIKGLVAGGTKEVMVLGQNVNSYGKDLENIDFPSLLRVIDKIEGLERIRFMSSHPKDISFELIDTIATSDKICEQIHLAIQSGSDEILRRMNRRYTTDHLREIMAYARHKIPHIGLSTDIIVGFPGETEEMFQETLDFMEEMNFHSAFTYVYSIRTGTPAATMPNQVSAEAKKDRMGRLLALIHPMAERHMKKYQDQVVEILVEGPAKNSGQWMMGRTRNHTTVTYPGDLSDIGKLVNVKITTPRQFSLKGEKV